MVIGHLPGVQKALDSILRTRKERRERKGREEWGGGVQGRREGKKKRKPVFSSSLFLIWTVFARQSLKTNDSVTEDLPPNWAAGCRRKAGAFLTPRKSLSMAECQVCRPDSVPTTAAS